MRAIVLTSLDGPDRAGVTAAFCEVLAKPLARAHARHAISTLGLHGIPYLLGVRDRETRP